MLDKVNSVMEEYESAEAYRKDLFKHTDKYDKEEFLKCEKILQDFPLEMAKALLQDLPDVHKIAKLICVMEE